MAETTVRQPRNRDRSRRAILQAAFDLSGEVGYSKLSIEAIAARAGAGKQTIYRWWPSKAAVLLDAILAQSSDEAGEIDLPDTGDIEVDLRAVLHATVHEFNDPRYDQTMRSLTVALLEDETLATQYRDRLASRMHEAKKERLRSAQQAGQLDPEADLDAAVEIIFGPLMNRWLTRSGPLTIEYVDTVLETALTGLRSPR